MDRRRLLLILAVFVAVIGTALVFLYVKGADKRANNQFDNVSVLKATQDIAAGETYDAGPGRRQDLAAAGAAERSSTNRVPDHRRRQLKGKIASVPIFAGQQIIDEPVRQHASRPPRPRWRSPRA